MTRGSNELTAFTALLPVGNKSAFNDGNHVSAPRAVTFLMVLVAWGAVTRLPPGGRTPRKLG